MHLSKLSLARGFSLIEMSVVVLLMSIFLTMGLGLLRTKQESAAWSETQIKKEKIKVALIQFLRINGRLPCPNNVDPWDGQEDSPCLTTLGRGVVPWQALGLSVKDAQDGWGNLISYRISNSTPATSSNWTINTGATSFNVSEFSLPRVALTVQERNTGGVLSNITNNAVVVLVSHGKNGAGARTIQNTQIALPAGADELQNVGLANTSFITKNPTEAAGATGGIYDDLVTYMTPSDLLQPLIDDKSIKGYTSQYYREQAILQVIVTSCTPPLISPGFATIQPSIGNGTITYLCPSALYACNTPTVIGPGTPSTTLLYQLSIFGAPAVNVTYGNVAQVFPSVISRCP